MLVARSISGRLATESALRRSGDLGRLKMEDIGSLLGEVYTFFGLFRVEHP